MSGRGAGPAAEGVNGPRGLPHKVDAGRLDGEDALDGEDVLVAAVGSVAEETARLLRVLGGGSSEDLGSQARRGPVDRGRSPEPADAPPAGGAGTRDGDARCACGSATSGETGGGSPRRHLPREDPRALPWCPMCRGAAFLRALSPETLERLADLAGVVSATLADLAAHAASTPRPAGGEDGRGSERSTATQHPSIQPVPVIDDDHVEEP